MKEYDPALAGLQKAKENLLDAEEAYLGKRYNACVNRAYYSIFQSALAVLMYEKYLPTREENYRHDFVQAEFIGKLIKKKKVFRQELGGYFNYVLVMRQVADYRFTMISEGVANRCLHHAREFVKSISERMEYE
jgi:uncharacterized protein (UPF0332 family)